ncbi:MAG: c-type cytochrome [Dongiaceae bacterium]
MAAAPAMMLAAAPALAEGDVAAGEKLFVKCKTCHALEAGKNKVGPSLAGLFGRGAGSLADFNYSDAMKASGITWDEATLGEYLADPKGRIPGNKMVFPGLKKDEDRANLIAYLKTATAQ